jgi:UDP-3-O-[3-hydroxymyristoyl] N-acetylglucosamine deacetylase
MRLNPAPADFGIVFVREDVNRQIKVAVENVTDTRLATVIANGEVSVSTIEHLLSAVMAMGIDNLEVVLDSDEVPIMDGSSASFCILFEEAGAADQSAVKRVLLVKKPVEIRDGSRFVRLSPGRINEIRFEIRFDHPAISRQEYHFVFSKENYIKEIARARTFGFLKEANYLRSIGKGLGGGLDNAVVLDEKRVLNTEGLRFADEFVRHKILDAIGDMAFLGAPFLGKYEAFAGSHHLNHLLTKSILSDSEAFEIVESESVSEAEKELERVFA